MKDKLNAADADNKDKKDKLEQLNLDLEKMNKQCK